MLHHVFFQDSGRGLDIYTCLLSFFHVAEYLLFLDSGNLYHYTYCMKRPFFKHERKATTDRVLAISLAIAISVELVAYILIFINRKVK
jgi:hypothetical protein